MKSSMLQKKEDEIYRLLERFYQKKDRKGITFSYSAKSRGSTSFVDLPFQEHWMKKKHHMDQIHTYLHYVQNQGYSPTIWHMGTMWHKARARRATVGPAG
jgi:hypothetical protein